MIEIEFEKPKKGTCDCCGDITTRLTRFVYKDEDAFAVYYAKFSDSHANNEVYVAISLGEWGEDSTPEQRLSYGIVLSSTESEYVVTITDADESPWKDVDLIGRMLNRDEALAHPWKENIFHITDHIVMEDREIIDYFARKETRT